MIEKYLHLEKKGGGYWACCPFHNEKTPSFSVNDDGFYYCFGCKETGDVISFVMKYESCDFLEAIEILAKNANMQIPEFTGDKEVFEKKTKKDKLLKLLALACNHYQENLYKTDALPAQQYVKKRKFIKKDLDDFKIGYSINGFEIINYLKKCGFTEQDMFEAGVVNKKDGRFFDISSKRLVFPIFNSFNECVGFSSRVLDNTLPKYINTPETDVFHKGRVVFAINLVKQLKQQGLLDKIIIVEGQIDVIAMHRAGFNSTVACMGTALTKENAHELKKLSNNVVLCFDGDTAGIKATIKSIDILKEEGLDVKIVGLPEKHDPDEILKENGVTYLQNLIENALPVTDFLINNELKKYNLNQPDQKGKFVTNCIEYISKLDSASEEEIYLEKLKHLTSIPIDVLRRDLEKISSRKFNDYKTSVDKNENTLISRESGNIKAVKFVLASLIHQKPFVDKKIDYKKLLPKYAEIIEKSEVNTPLSSYFDYFDIENNPVLKDCIEMNFNQFEDNGKVYFEGCLWQIASQNLMDKQAELNKKFKECVDLDERQKLAIQLQDTLKAIKDKNMEEFYVRY